MAPHSYRAVVLTVSDSRSSGEQADTAGPALQDILKEKGFVVTSSEGSEGGVEAVSPEVVPDAQGTIEEALIRLAASHDLVITTGGTGLGPRDVTPEATCAVCDRLVPGISEWMRAEGMKRTPFAALSRNVCGSRGKALIVNLPGNPAGAADSLHSVIEIIPHALDLLRGNTRHGVANPDAAAADTLLKDT